METDNIHDIYKTIRKGGNCSVIKLEPFQQTSTSSKMLASLLVRLMVDEYWKNGIDVIKTYYNRYDSYGIILMTNVENVEKLRDLINTWELTESYNGKFVINVKNLLKSVQNHRESSFTTEIYENEFAITFFEIYKHYTPSNILFPVEDSLTVKQEDEYISPSARSYNSVLSVADKKVLASNNHELLKKYSKKVALPLSVVLLLANLVAHFYRKYKSKARALSLEARDTTTSDEPGEPGEPGEPAEPAEPAEPGEPSDRLSFDINLRSSKNVKNNQNKLMKFLSELEETENTEKHRKKNNKQKTSKETIENRILKLLEESTTTH